MQHWYPHALLACLLCPVGTALATDAIPDVEQANAAYRRALEADVAARPKPPSPLAAALLEGMRIEAVQGCQPTDAGSVTCIVRLDAGMRRGFQAYRFRRDDAAWALTIDPDTATPAPSLAQAQLLVRQGLSEDGARQSDPARRAAFEQAASEATVISLQACELDRDDGSVECDLRLRLPDSEPSARQGFELRGGTWNLLPH